MQNDDYPGTPAGRPSAESGAAAGYGADPLEDATERLDRSSWGDSQSAHEAEDRLRNEPGFAEPEEEGVVKAFLERQLRERPLPTLLLGVAAGWLVGKLLR